MKQSSIIILLTMFISMVSTKAVAHDIEVKNSDGVTIYYNWIDNHKNLAVTYKGSHFPRDGQSYSGNVVIPESVEYEGNTYNVTEIGNRAFYSCQNLTSVKFPNGITTIGEEVFQSCIKLNSITIPKNVTSIRADAFYGCSGLTSVHISDIAAWCNISFSRTLINYEKNWYRSSNPLFYAHHLFLNGIEVTTLVIPDSVKSIQNYAFEGCRGLTSVTIPNSVTNIGNQIFKGCNGLTSITIPNSVTSIGDFTFYDCSSLTSITIPNSVTDIGDEVFSGCTELASITISNSLKYIGKDAFKDTKWYNNLPDGLVYTGLIAYKYKGTMPENTEVVLKDGTVSIGEWAFSGCSGMSSISIPNSVTSIGENAFQGCNSLTSVNISDIAAWCDINFAPHNVGGYSYCFSNPLRYAKHLYLNGEEITDLTIPYGVTAISNRAFIKFSGLTSVTIPNSVTEIGISAFRGCTNLMTITIGSGVTSIGGFAFAKDNGFYSRTRTDNDVLKVFCKAETVPETNSYAFEGCNIDQGLLIVPDNAVAAYQAVAPWSGFGTISSETDYSGIEGINMNSVNARIYDLRGNHLENLHKGVNIIKKNNGTIKKVFVK
jgi:hypothetical protein